jgi:RNA polymerase sigma-70 factor (ECF subfamily)
MVQPLAAGEDAAGEHGGEGPQVVDDGLSYSEIAAATGVSIGTVMSRLFNGRRKLVKALANLGVKTSGGWL